MCVCVCVRTFEKGAVKSMKRLNPMSVHVKETHTSSEPLRQSACMCARGCACTHLGAVCGGR